jgi:hypothetical protein
MQLFRSLSGLALMATAASAAVDPALLNLVMPQAKVLYGIQVQQSLGSPFGRYLLARPELANENTPVARFMAAAGFDYRRDLREVLLASTTGATGTQALEEGLLLARGTFLPERFAALAQAAGIGIEDHHGVRVIVSAGAGGHALAFLESTLAALGSEEAVKSAIDRNSARAAFTGPLAKKALAASVDREVWFATVTPLSELMPATQNSPVPSTLAGAVVESNAGVHFGDQGATLTAEALTHSQQEAQALADALRFLFGMLNGSPAEFLKDARFAVDGVVTRITLAITERDLERSLQPPAR